MLEIEVVHLAWKPAGIEPFKNFVRAYREYPAGVAHGLLVLWKAFEGGDLDQHRNLIVDIPHRELEVPNRGLDINAYFWSAQHSQAQYLCFLNSHSAPLADGWLRRLYLQLIRPGVGAVGATGSWESSYTNYMRRIAEVGPPTSIPGWIKHIYRRRQLNRYRADFSPEPNPHLRTNAFMMGRERWLSLQARPIRTKWQALQFENGKQGMTPQLLSQGVQVLVVGRDGQSYPPSQWAESGTFRHGDQRNLLVADNRTRQYADADEAAKRHMREIAWGRA